MCGITAYISSNGKPGIEYIINSLKQLQNRGYDSAGIVSVINNNFIIEKYASVNTNNAIELLELHIDKFRTANILMGHTRWATHGAKTDINAHPHIDTYGLFSIVHNGIIENYQELKNFLMERKYTFKSQTDTEVIVNLLSYYYIQCKITVEESIQKTISKLSGTWGLVIMFKDEPNKLYITRNGSPILIGIADNVAYICSEKYGFCNKVDNYFALNNNDICVIDCEKEIKVITQQVYTKKSIKDEFTDLSPSPYKYWTLKEIYEQSESSLRAINNGGRILNDSTVQLGGIEMHRKELLQLTNIVLLGCGTSYHACMYGSQVFKELCNFATVQYYDGGEFNMNDLPKNGKTGCILLSQSGETKDLHRCIEICKSNDIFMIGVINVVDSMIAREVDCGCYLNAGREVAVASTKAFTSQIILLHLIALWFAQNHNINEELRKKYINDLKHLHIDIKHLINDFVETIDKYVDNIYMKNSLFILGKGKCEAIAKEGALKIKEICYIHAEGYSGSSLKHGPFGLLEKDFPVILIALEDYAKMKNVYEEVKSRNAKIIFITDDALCQIEDSIIIPQNNSFRYLLSVIPLQLIAYYVSIRKGINPDYPRNLAKVVTVE